MDSTSLVITSDGSHTIYVPELKEHYHSVNGAIRESEHVFIKNGLNHCQGNPVYVLEIGFGTGLNAFLTALSAYTGKREIFYSSIEKYPLPCEIVSKLNYPDITGGSGRPIFDRIHMSGWGTMTEICTHFSLRKLKCDLVNESPEGRFDLIYFDAFGPDKQPEMWTKEIFRKISEVTAPGGILVTYSAKGEVKRNLESTGFIVSRLPGSPGKRHMIRAIKQN